METPTPAYHDPDPGTDPDTDPGLELAPGLYVTATPIGNLQDMTLRAIAVLRGADVILCEDTRVTVKLCRRFDIATPLEPYHEHNAAKVRPRILERLKAGGRLALVSDAGTPLISDPGYQLVREARAQKSEVFSVPGPSALTAALSISGQPTDAVYFGGFLPTKTVARQKLLQSLDGLGATLVFYESPHRLAATLTDFAALSPTRPASICRELTKFYEEVRSGTLADLAAYYQDRVVKGEIVLVLAPLRPEARDKSDAEIDAQLKTLLSDHRVKEAAELVAEQLGVARKRVYARALIIKEQSS